MRSKKSFLSKELQIGKGGEHLVCFDLIKSSHNAFLADQGLPYDVILDVKGKLFKIQVKTTLKPIATQNRLVYSFGLRSSKLGRSVPSFENIDIVAFVAVDLMKVAYLSKSQIINKRTGVMKRLLHFKSSSFGIKIDRKSKKVTNYLGIEQCLECLS